MKIQLNTEVKDTDMGCYIEPTTGNMYSKTQFSEIKDTPSKSISKIKAQFEKLFIEAKSIIGCDTLDIRISQVKKTHIETYNAIHNGVISSFTANDFNVVVNINIS
ncbi:MAG: hypothetical protein IKY94_11380 [Lachnospiraceae bacterium]|nr:hypothetical protein [Lachnospiraceae bacterium]